MPIDTLLQEILRRQQVLETNTEERHTENLNTQAQTRDDVRGMHAVVEDHVRADEKAFEEIRRSLVDNTKITSSVYSVVQKIEAARTLGTWIRSGLGWLAAVALSAAIIFAVILWAMGRGPFPVIHP